VTIATVLAHRTKVALCPWMWPSALILMLIRRGRL
jgi:hypothetical protein